jgi:ketopantoate reductase
MLDKRKGYPKHSSFQYTYQLTEKLASGNKYDYIIIAVRVCQLEELLKELSGLTGNTCTVIFTGNWNETDFIEQYLPKCSFLLADPIAGGTFHGSTLVATLNNTLPMGEIDGSRTERLSVLENTFCKAGIQVVHQKDILHWHWVQFALNAATWPALVRAKSLESILKDKSLIDDMFHSAAECINVCIERGVDINAFPEVKTYTITSKLKTFLMRSIFAFILKHSEYHRRCMSHALDDPKEIKTFYDSVLITGKGLGLQMPYYSKFQKDIESFYKQGVVPASVSCTET